MIRSLLLAIAPVCQDWAPPPPPPVVPSPLLVQPRFAPFVVPQAPRVVTSEPVLEGLASVVAESLGTLLGRPVEVGAPPATSGDVVLTLGYLADPVAGDPEGLSIEVFADHVALSGSSPGGVARAAARMLQLFEHDDEGGAWSLPAVRIDDAPVYSWRAIEYSHPGRAEDVRDVVHLAFLSSFNVVVLREVATDTPWLDDVERHARLREIRIVLEDSAPPYARSTVEGDASLPVLWVGDPDINEIPAAFAGRRLIDATSETLRLVSGPTTDAARARAFAYRPLRGLGGTDSATSPGARVMGAQVRLRAGDSHAPGADPGADLGAGPATESAGAVPDLLPYLVERMWGSRQTPDSPDVFRTRADAFLRRTRALARNPVPNER